MHRFELKTHYFLKSEINELFITNALRTFAISTISIFIPIFLYQKGYSMIDICLYLITWVIIAILANYNVLKFISKHGIKHAIALSIPIIVAFFLVLYNIDTLRQFLGDYVTLYLLAILKAVQAAFFFMGFHLEFAKFCKKESSTKQLGIMNATATILSIIGPLVGAMVISWYGFNTMFFIIIVVLALSVVPLFFSKDTSEMFEVDFRKIIKSFGKHNSWPFFAEGVRSMAAMYFWPLLFYFVIQTIEAIGGVYTISRLMVALLTIYVGKKATDLNRKKILKAGAYLHSFTLFTRVFVKTVLTITFVQGVGGISWAMLHLPFHTIFYNNSKKKGIAYMTFYREVFLQAGRLAAVLVLLLMLLVFSVEVALIVSVIIGALSVFVMMMIEEE